MKIDSYFKRVSDETKSCYDVANAARKKGLDPIDKVESPVATTLAAKVAGLVESLYPQLNNKIFINRIISLEKEHGSLDPVVTLTISEEVAKEKFCKFKDVKESIEAGIRVGLAYITLGVVSSPIEGFTGITIKKTKEGKDFFAAYFSGPIRSAGGTAASFSQVIVDYLRERFGYARYDPTDEEVKRVVTEINDYHDRITNLQYKPTDEESEFLAKNMPIQIAGDPSTKKEVSNYKGLDRIETDFIRSGFCLAFAEGMAQKAPKILKRINYLKEKGFVLKDWDWLEKYVELKNKKKEKGADGGGKPTYIKDLVGGRPVLGHPGRSGNFRLRYGRARNTGFSCLGMHPSTMVMTQGFIATGTQLKIELPTKGAAMAPVDTIEGPIVKLKNGSIRKLNNEEEARNVSDSVEEIIYLGDMLIPYGDFSERNHVLMPSGYCEQEWYQELKNFSDEEVNIENIYDVSFEKAKEVSNKYGVNLHPNFIFYWTQINFEDLMALLDWISHSRYEEKLILPFNNEEKERFSKGKRALEVLGVPHEVVTENVVVNKYNTQGFFSNLNLKGENLEEEVEEIAKDISDKEDVLKIINILSDYKIKDKAGTFIGSRMGRPEKAKLRKLQGSPNVLFPVGSQGGKMRSVTEAVEKGFVNSDFPLFQCKECDKKTVYKKCDCGGDTKRINYCFRCGEEKEEDNCPEHGNIGNYSRRDIDIKEYFKKSVDILDLLPAEIPKLVKGVKGTSNEDHVVEHLAKGIIRAKMDLQVNKDGTIRYDATELPLTHFKPREIGTSIAKLRELGYKRDINGNELKSNEQVLEILPHDIVLPSCPDASEQGADEVFMRVANFIDVLLKRFYGMDSFYNINSKEDLIGHYMAAIAPHNCAGTAARIIGFSKTQGLLASPYIHAACRRDCLAYENYVPVKKDGVWQISKIGDFIENEDPKEKADNFGTLKKEIDSKTFSNPGVAKIKEVTKHEPRKLFNVSLEDGREIKLTGNHKVYLKGKDIKNVRDLNLGDKLTVSYKKNIEEKDIDEIFLPEIFKDRKDVMVKNVNSFLKNFTELDKSSNFYQRDSYPIKEIIQVLRKNNKTLRELPLESKITIKRDNIPLPTRISLDKNLLEIIGLYIAGGFTRKNTSSKGVYQISIAGNEEMRDRVKKAFKKYFNLDPSEDSIDHVTFSSRIIYEIFNNYLKIGSSAKEKRIPSLFLNLKKEKIAALLRGYFEGNGSFSITDRRVTCDIISEGLKHDLSFVLSRFGIFTKFYKYKKKTDNIVEDFYLKKNKEVPELEITKIIIPCDFINKFEKIGFLSERKKCILYKLIERDGRGMKIDFDENYIYPQVIGVKEVETDKNFCFNVEGDHNFFSNDILVKNCDGDEISVILLLDLLLNFSKKFLPAHRGGTQDAPLVLNTRVRAGEVDDMIFEFDAQKELPLELYKLGMEKKDTGEIELDQIGDRLGSNKAFKNILYEYEVGDINSGVLCSNYKKLNTMQEKVQKQMEVAESIRSVEVGDVARLIIDRHFIRDIRGNLRKFSHQQFRCGKCNSKYRRPPLKGQCLKCGNNLIFTISEGSIVKYLEPAIQLAEKYDIPPYIKQSLDLTKGYIEGIFGRDKEKQENLQEWF